MWLREMIETGWHRAPLSADEKRSLLRRLIEVFQFERFLQKAYLGQKMFSIEGLDVTVPMIDEIATLARQNGAEEVVIGMAHRGRLAVLAHNLGRSVESILAEFEGAKALDQVKAITAMPHSGTGDVKYHHGAEGLFSFNGDQVKVRLYPEPEPPRVRRPGGHRRGARRADRALRPASSTTTHTSPCRCCCTATRPSRARAWSPRRSTCSRSPATRPAARST